ncbi:hypothetical protein IMCC3135_19745 [Granulosicoccus antarcticus IMCC3135]|uniref:Lipid A deacylase LpxR family protein n=2 Tax=Granulosicoccus TaxID=437504 RepID=A0A2Z2NWD5_9GAMM|nr:hypothetical protein IMCC3135_19745 [Granulosicoccus antarcticus IMCC3135]
MMLASQLMFVLLMSATQANASDSESEGELFPDTEPGQAWTLTFENDIFAGTDGGYTNGIGFSVAHGPYESFTENNLPGWLLYLTNKTYMATLPDRQRAVAYSYSQSMHTPTDITVTELQLDEPPYAGFLGARAMLYAFDKIHSDQLSLTVGVVGELSLAEPSQRFIHRITGSEEPKGWDNQLGNELVFLIAASHGERVFASSSERALESDLILRGTAGVGTIQSGASVSAVFRVGNLLELSHATASLLPDRQVNNLAFLNDSAWYAFVGGEVGVVVNDIFINGNTFRDSHSVPLDHSRSMMSAGVSWNMGTFAFTLLYAETKGGGEVDPFGSFSITHQY